MAPGQQASAEGMAVEGAEDEGEADLAATNSMEAAGVADTAATTRATDAVAADSMASAAIVTRADICGEPAAVGKVTLPSVDYWVIDSGATYSMTPRADLLTKLEPSLVKHVTLALGQRAEVKGMGKAMFKGANGKMVGLKNVLWVLNLAANLISVRRLQKAGMDTSSKGAKTYTARLGEQILWDLHKDKDVYNKIWQIPVVPMPKERQVAASISTKGEAVGSGDGANGRAKSKKCNLGGISKLGEHEESGVAAQNSEATAKAPLDEVVMDVVGPLKLGAARAEQFLTIVDVNTRITWVYVLSKKSDVAETVKTDWLPMVERQQDRDSNFMENPMYKDLKAENEAKIGTRFGEVKSSGLEHVELPLELSSGSTTTRQSSLVNGGEEAKDAEEEEEEVQQVSERAPTLPSRTMSAPQIRVTPQQRHESLHVPAAEKEGRGKRKIQAPIRLTYDALGKRAKSALAGAAMMAITSKWLFKIKSDADGKIERYKSSLVAKGYQQKEKVDYKELFAPAVKPTTLRTLLAGATIKGWVVKQMDVTTAFLNGVLEEEIFMAQPEGFDDGSGRVWKLKKALYGLKQAPRQWYLKLREVLEEIRFTPSSADHSLFMLGEGEQRSFMWVYVDDILIFSPSSDLVKEVMLKLQDKFKCNALDDVSFYLGLHIERDVEKRCMCVHQWKYIEALAALGKVKAMWLHPFSQGSKPLGAVSIMAGPEERGGRGAGGTGEVQAQGQHRDSAMAPVQPSLGPPRDEPRVFGLGKFNGDNFVEWSFRMENVFDHYDLLEVMEGTEKHPENDPEKSPRARKSAQGYLLLGQALGSSQIRHIKPFQHEPEKGPKAWATLKGVHAPATAAVAVVLERQMAALRIEEDEALEEGVQEFFDLLTRLERADLNYSELQKKTKLLALLPESWSSLIINLNCDLPRLSFEDMKRAILQEDFRRQEQEEGEEEAVEAVAVAEVVLEPEESGAAAKKQHKGEENPKAAAEEEYGESMLGTIASAAFSNLTSATGECDWLTLH
ncbi:unnamed protein product [Closterium sp. NIES-53]